ncbi:MAG: hypothetical protein IJ468_06840 [Lachnospiraceae bacterium]|nr:hypothetical protein [Lachnospiraceae bacterium]
MKMAVTENNSGMSTVRIDVQQVKKAGESFIENVDKLYDELCEIESLIAASKNYFDSEAATDLRYKFSKSAETFSRFQTFLKQYGEYIKTYAGNIEGIDAKVEETLYQFSDI